MFDEKPISVVNRKNCLNLNKPRENRKNPLEYVSPVKYQKLNQDKVERENVQHSLPKNNDQRQKKEKHSSTYEQLKDISQIYNDKQERESSQFSHKNRSKVRQSIVKQ